MILVVGSTGLLGGAICRHLRAQGRDVRALVRSSSDGQKVAELRGQSIEVVTGDLKDGTSLRAACQGVDTVVSTATAMLSRAAGDSLATVDLEGQASLVRAATEARVRRFAYVSVPAQPLEYPLQSAKRTVEAQLARSGIPHTIFRPTNFTEVWLGPALWPFHGLNFDEGRARFVAPGDQRIHWISFLDVARLVAQSVAGPEGPASQSIDLAGPEALSLQDVVALMEKKLGRPVVVEMTPPEALRQRLATLEDPIEKSLTALMLICAAGDPPGFASSAETTLRGDTRVTDHLDRSLPSSERI